MHDTCLPSFHHGTCPSRLNCQVFTRGRFIFLYFFDFLTSDYLDVFLVFSRDVGTTMFGRIMRWIELDGLEDGGMWDKRYGGGKCWDGRIGKDHEMRMLSRSTLAHVGRGDKRM